MVRFWFQYSKIIQNPSHVELQKAANQGRRCTWEKLSAIKANCAIELALDECVALLNHMRRLKRSAERAAASQGHANFMQFSASRRIPSWNCIARENSSGSLEEDLIVDSAAAIHQGSPSVGQSNRNNLSQRSIHDGSDSESETIDLNSWTRNGGPLMRTYSAAKFISFVQSLEVESEFNRLREEEADVSAADPNPLGGQLVGRGPHYNNSRIDIDRSSENIDSVPVASPTSITVSTGDLLQPEKIQNGIMFNIVKAGALLNRSSESESQQDHSRVADEENVCMEICDASTASDSGEDEVDPAVKSDYQSPSQGDAHS